MKFGYCTTFDNYELLDKLGYDYIELAGRDVVEYDRSRLDEMERIIKSGRVKCCGFNSAVPAGVPIVGDSYSPEKTKEYAEKLCEVGAKLGIGAIGIGSPACRRLPYGYNVPLADSQAKEFLSVFCDVAAPYEIKILWEHLNPTEGNYGLTWNHGIELVKKTGRENLGLVCDLYHIDINRESLNDLDREPSLIGHVHLAQLEGHNRFGLLPAYVGRYEQYQKKLPSHGNHGIVSIEAFSGNAEEEAARSIEILKKL